MDDVLVDVVEVDAVAVEELVVDEVEVLNEHIDMEDVEVAVEDVLVDEVEQEDVGVDEVHEDAVEVEVQVVPQPHVVDEVLGGEDVLLVGVEIDSVDVCWKMMMASIRLSYCCNLLEQAEVEVAVVLVGLPKVELVLVDDEVILEDDEDVELLVLYYTAACCSWYTKWWSSGVYCWLWLRTGLLWTRRLLLTLSLTFSSFVTRALVSLTFSSRRLVASFRPFTTSRSGL